MSLSCPFCGAPTDYLTVTQVSRMLGVTYKTIYKYIRQGRFEGTVKVQGLTSPMYKIPASAVLPLLQAKEARS